MIRIDCAFDENLAKELKEFLAEQGVKSKLEKSFVLVEQHFENKLLDQFLKKTKRTKHAVKKPESDSYLISQEISVEEFGLGTCEICGYVAFEEELFSHRRTHGI